MNKFKKCIVVSFLILIVLSVAAAFLKLSGSRVPGRAAPAKHMTDQAVIVPPASSGGATRASRTSPNRKAATRKALRCLNALCETGASDDAISHARGLVAQLDAAPQPFAKALSAVLKSTLSFLDGNGGSNYVGSAAASIPGFSGIPSFLIDRAAAACDARGRRKPGEVVLSFAGDCTFGTVNGDNSDIRFPSVYRRSGRADYPFALIKPWFLNDDLSIVNFECTLTNATSAADKQWHFKGAARYATLFPAGSVEAVGLSNNHSFDYLKAGFNDTVANFGQAHVPVFYQNAPFIRNVPSFTLRRGVEVVIIGDCTVVGENTTLIDGAPERVIREIKRYKKPGNIVVVVMHWGSELDTVPRPWQQELGRKLIDAGADAVVGHHPHVVQGIELYKGKTIAYSLGNFAFGGNSLARYPETVVLRLRFHAGDGKSSDRQTRVMAPFIVPCWVTSSQARNTAGILKNNYQPKPVFGETADRTVALVLKRSARLKYGVKKIQYLRLR